MFNAVSFGDYAAQRLAICQEAGSHMNTTTSQQDDGGGTSVHLNWFARSAGNGEVIRNTFGADSVTGYTKVWKSQSQASLVVHAIKLRTMEAEGRGI